MDRKNNAIVQYLNEATVSKVFSLTNGIYLVHLYKYHLRDMT